MRVLEYGRRYLPPALAFLIGAYLLAITASIFEGTQRMLNNPPPVLSEKIWRTPQATFISQSDLPFIISMQTVSMDEFKREFANKPHKILIWEGLTGTSLTYLAEVQYQNKPVYRVTWRSLPFCTRGGENGWRTETSFDGKDEFVSRPTNFVGDQDFFGYMAFAVGLVLVFWSIGKVILETRRRKTTDTLPA